MTRASFLREGYGFWGSLGDWIREGVCCVLLNRHEWELHAVDRQHCRRCGIASGVC